MSAEFIKIKGKVTPFSYKLFSLPSIDEFITNHTLCPPNTNDAVSVQVTPSPDSVFEGLFFTIKPKEPFRWFYFGFSKNGWTIPWTTSGIEMKMSLPMSELENFELPSGTGFLRWTPEAIDFPLSRQSQFSLEEELFLVGHILDNLECCRDEDCPSAAEKCSGNRCTISGCSHNGHLGYCETNTENCPGLAAPGDDCPGGGGGNSYCCIGQTTRIQCSVAQGNTGSSASGFCLKRGAAEQQQCEFSISGASECAIYGGDTVCCVNRPNCKDNQGRPGSCVSLLSNQATNCKVPVSSVQWCESLEADASCCIHEDIECSYGDFKGECMRTSICGSEEYDGDPIRGLCPGGENIRCCLLDMPEESCISDNRYAGSCLGEEECNNLQMTPLDNFTNPRRDCTENKACCVEPPGCTSYHPTDDSKTVVGLCLHNESVCTLDSVSGLCPGRAPIQCCADLSLFYCSSGDPLDTREGRCQDKDLYCAGRVTKDECPGHSEIQCCLPPLEHEGYVAMGDSSSLPQPACFRLTDASAWRTGAVWSTSLLDVSQSFEISVELSFGIEDTTGADGIVFVLQTDGINALGEPGRDIGFKGIAPSLGVEFDTYENPPEQVAPEISADHVAIVWGGDLGNVMAGPSQIGADPTNIEDGDMHTARFVWDSVEEVFSIYFDGEQVILSNDVELYGYDLSMILGSQYAVWGFTSATGSYSNEHSVCIENLNAETEPLATWEKMGAAVNGSANGDDFGSSLAISSNGLVVAVGAMNFASPTNIGYVAVYQWDGSLWKPMGSRIDSLKSYDWLGFRVALSGDGTTLVTGGLAGDYLRVMRYVGSDWVEEAVLQPEPELGSTFFGLSLSISGDGNTIAVGETNVHPLDQSEGLHGMVRTYQRTGSVWSQIGSDIYGASSTDRCGQSVSLSFDGAVLATGCSQSGEGKGYVQTYFWLTGHWVRVWPNLEGDDMLDEFGGRVHLSDNGLALAALAWDGRYAKVYEWDGIRWITKGSPILGLAGGFYQLSLSGDGSTVLAGTSPMALGDGYATAGWARVIRWTGTEWQQIGLPLQGSNTEQLSSNSISFDGNTVALGWSDQNNAEAPGHFQAYTLVD